MENKKIIEYLEVNDGTKYFLKENYKGGEKEKRKYIEEVYRSTRDYRDKQGKKDFSVTFFTNKEIVSVNDLGIHKLIAPEAIEIDCKDNNIVEIYAPKATKIDCSYNPLEKVTAPNCKEINIKIISFGERKNPLKENFILAEDCKITDTDMYFYKDEFYAFIKDREGNRISFIVGIDGKLIVDKRTVPLSPDLALYVLETNAKYIDVKLIIQIEKIYAPNAISIDCRGTEITELDLPKAKDIKADYTSLKTINAPNAIFVACKNTSVKTLNLPLAESIDCEGCKHLEEVYAPNCTSIDFTDTNIKQGGLIIKGIKD
jgi:hypothetical protein